MGAVLRTFVRGTLLGTVAIACDSFSASGVDPSDGGSSADAVPDATTGSVDASAAADADVGVADAAKTFCPDAATYFCDDFERVELVVGTEWKQRQSGSAGLRIDPPKPFSSSRTLHGDVAASEGGAVENHLYHAYAAIPQTLDLSFDMYVPAGASPEVHVAGFVFHAGDGGKESAVGVSIKGGLVNLFEHLGGVPVKDVPGDLDVGVWTRYQLRVDTGSKRARLTIEGKPADVELTLALDHAMPKEARLGIVRAGVQTLPFKVSFDDIALFR